MDAWCARHTIYRCFVRGPQVGNGGTIALRFDAKIFYGAKQSGLSKHYLILACQI